MRKEINDNLNASDQNPWIICRLISPQQRMAVRVSKGWAAKRGPCCSSISQTIENPLDIWVKSGLSKVKGQKKNRNKCTTLPCLTCEDSTLSPGWQIFFWLFSFPPGTSRFFSRFCSAAVTIWSPSLVLSSSITALRLELEACWPSVTLHSPPPLTDTWREGGK